MPLLCDIVWKWHGFVVQRQDIIIDAAIIVNFFQCGGRHFKPDPVIQGFTKHPLIYHIWKPLLLCSCVRVGNCVTKLNVFAMEETWGMRLFGQWNSRRILQGSSQYDAYLALLYLKDGHSYCTLQFSSVYWRIAPFPPRHWWGTYEIGNSYLRVRSQPLQFKKTDRTN